MKKATLIVLICLSAFNLNAQKKEVKEKNKVYRIDSTKVLTLDKTIKTLYNVISGEKGAIRNWGEFKFLFKPDAKLIPSGKNKAGIYKVKYMSPADYIKSSGKWLIDNGFFEKEIHREIQTFGNITHVFSTYQAFHSESDETPFMRGINSIQLLNDGKRWWIVNIYWTQESKEIQIPEKYLSN